MQVLEMVVEWVQDREDKKWGALAYGEEPQQPFLPYKKCGSNNLSVLRAWCWESFFLNLPVAEEEREEDFCLLGGSA